MENMNGMNPYEAGYSSAQPVQQFRQPMQPAQQVQPVAKVTTLHDLQSYSIGTVVNLPDFAEGQPLTARIVRPSMLVLAKQGKIPNTLLNAAGELFAKGTSSADPDNTQMLSDMYDVMHIICESALVEPTMQEIESVGLHLTDEQMMALFSYSQVGVKALESFRKE